jgi:hypothetical protein
MVAMVGTQRPVRVELGPDKLLDILGHQARNVLRAVGPGVDPGLSHEQGGIEGSAGSRLPDLRVLEIDAHSGAGDLESLGRRHAIQCARL